MGERDRGEMTLFSDRFERRKVSPGITGELGREDGSCEHALVACSSSCSDLATVLSRMSIKADAAPGLAALLDAGDEGEAYEAKDVLGASVQAEVAKVRAEHGLATLASDWRHDWNIGAVRGEQKDTLNSVQVDL